MKTEVKDIARDLASDLGPSFSYFVDYAYAAPSYEGLGCHSLDSAIFSNPIPSISSATVGFKKVSGDVEVDDLLKQIAFSGCTIVAVLTRSKCNVYSLTAPFIYEKVESINITKGPEWIRNSIKRAYDRNQLTFQFEGAKSLVISEAKGSLRKVVSRLMEEVKEQAGVTENAAFLMSMRVLRTVLLGPALSSSGVNDEGVTGLALKFANSLNFSNLPLDSIGDLYEQLATDPMSRKRLGVVYTPSWFANYVVSRLPPDCFLDSMAVDPTCGSGTFLLSFMERAIREKARRNLPYENLGQIIAGMDCDYVAIEATRLCLDLLARRMGIKGNISWNIQLGDSTKSSIESDVLIGNLPFGYRTYENKQDISSVILERWLNDSGAIPIPKFLAIILPESFLTSDLSVRARSLLRRTFRIDEIIRLPETFFSSSSVRSVCVIATRGGDDGSGATVVRDVRQAMLKMFETSGVSTNYAAPLPLDLGDPWTFSPFFGEFDQAESRRACSLGALSKIHLGLQSYGNPDCYDRDGHAVLEDSEGFIDWDGSLLPTLRRIRHGEKLRRSGPQALFDESKIIVRTTTNPEQKARLAAFVDTTQLWFTDKFVGIWVKDESIPAGGIVAYFQTRFVELWISAYNSSRKLRIASLNRIPIPKLRIETWQAAAKFVNNNRTFIAPRWRTQTSIFDDPTSCPNRDWEAFERAVDAAFGISENSSSEMEEYLRREMRVGRI